MAKASGLSQSSGQPHLARLRAAAAPDARRFKLSKDPLFIEKVRDIVGLYLNPPDRALVLCVDEKTPDPGPRSHAAAAADAAGPGRAAHARLRPPRHHVALRRARREDRHGHRRVPPAPPRASSSASSSTRSTRPCPPTSTCTSSSTTTAPTRRALIHRWLAKRPRFHLHFTPTSASWLNLVERWFALLTEKQIRRGRASRAPGRSKRRSGSTSP